MPPIRLSPILSRTQILHPYGILTFNINLFYAFCESFMAIGAKLRELWSFSERRYGRNRHFTIKSLYIQSNLNFL